MVGTETAFTISEFKSWKKALKTFRNHEKTSSHSKLNEKYKALHSRTTIAKQLNSAKTEEQNAVLVCLRTIFTSIQFLARQTSKQGKKSKTASTASCTRCPIAKLMAKEKDHMD